MAYSSPSYQYLSFSYYYTCLYVEIEAAKPSFLPTPSIASSVQLRVTQKISLASYSDYVKSESLYERTIKEAIVLSLISLLGKSITIENTYIQNFQVSYAWQSMNNDFDQRPTLLIINYSLESSMVYHFNIILLSQLTLIFQ